MSGKFPSELVAPPVLVIFVLGIDGFVVVVFEFAVICFDAVTDGSYVSAEGGWSGVAHELSCQGSDRGAGSRGGEGTTSEHVCVHDLGK